MTREEQLRKMQTIAKEYLDTPENLRDICSLAVKYHTKYATICKYFTENNISIVKHTTKNPSKTMLINIAVDEYIATPESTRSAASIAAKYGLNRKTIIAYAKNRGFVPTQHHNKPVFNNTVFDEIDTEEKAYWLGFMYADGYICINSNHIGLSLALSDIEHLKKFNTFLQYPKGLNVNQNGVNKNGDPLWKCTTEFGDTHMWESLKRNGCVPNKSLILNFPQESVFKSKDLIRHFIRGYWDGDGSLGLYNNVNYANALGTKNFLEGVQQYSGIKGYLHHKSGENIAVHCLKYTNLKAFKLIEWLYKDSTIYLERKYNIYEQISRKEKSLKNRAKSGEAEIANPEVSQEIAKGS